MKIQVHTYNLKVQDAQTWAKHLAAAGGPFSLVKKNSAGKFYAPTETLEIVNQHGEKWAIWEKGEISPDR